MTTSSMKYKKIKCDDKEMKKIAYAAGISAIGMAYKLSIAPIDIADALIVEKEALNLQKNFFGYFDKFTPKMLMNISISALNISKNLEEKRERIQVVHLS